jgi:hypothetical protein
MNRSAWIAKLVAIFAAEGRERRRRWGLVQGRRVIQEIDELLGVLRERQEQGEGYDGWLNPPEWKGTA